MEAGIRARFRGVAVGTLCAWVSLAQAQRPDSQRGDAPQSILQPARAQQTQFHLPDGFEIQLVASEPDIRKPLNLAFDAQGRVWVSTTELYPWPARTDALGERIASFDKHWEENAAAFRAAVQPPTPRDAATDAVYVLSDFAPDGRPGSIRVFTDGLNIPIGLQPLPRRPGQKGDTLIVYSIPAIWKLEDVDGDGRADTRERLYEGFGFKDTHGMSSNYTYWMDGWIYGTHGFANQSNVRDRSGRVTSLFSGNTYRFRPDGFAFQLWANGQTNPFGLAFDSRGDVYTADSHSKPVYLLLPGGYYEGINRTHDGLGFAPSITEDSHGSSAIAGIAHYSARQFPAEYWENLFNGNPVTRRVNRARLDWTGSTPAAVRLDDFLSCDDPSFRPIQVKLGPDGALWIADFYNPIIGHYESPLTHPDRDRSHGRIWRIVWRGTDSAAPPPVLRPLPTGLNATIAQSLADKNLVVRTLAVNELVSTWGQAAVPGLRAWCERLADPEAAEAALPVFSALERLGALEERWLRQAMTRPDLPESAQVAALRILQQRDSLGTLDEGFFRDWVAGTRPGHAWRQLALLLGQQPRPWCGPLLLQMRAAAPAADTELVYALRLALKAAAASATLETLRRWSGELTSEKSSLLADVLVAVDTPAAGAYLMDYLAERGFADPKLGELIRHAVAQVPTATLAGMETLVDRVDGASLDARAALAEGFADVVGREGPVLTPRMEAWTKRTLLAAFAEADNVPLVRRAVMASKTLDFPERYPVLQALATDSTRSAGLRDAIVRNLGAAPLADKVFLAVGKSKGSTGLRRLAIDQLAFSPPERLAPLSDELTSLLPGAPSDVALAVAIALSKTDTGAQTLLDAIAAGRTQASLLRHRYVARQFESRAPELKARLAALTKNLPSEDARVDAVIAQRVAGYALAKGDATQGESVFLQHCAVCHRMKNAGGTLGPNLDGVASRDLARLVEDILDPSRNVDPLFRVTLLTTREGRSYSGTGVHETAGTLMLTSQPDGEQIALKRVDIASRETTPLSPMPAAYDQILAESDFYDLLAFLQRPR